MNINKHRRWLAVSMAVACMGATLGGTANAASYYVDSVAGNDSNAGTSPTLAWKTLAKLNTWLASSAVAPAAIGPGDTVYLMRGSVWDESLVIRRSGASRNPIVFTPYGDADAPPTIRASIAVPSTGWTQDGLVWKTTAVSADIRQVAFTRGDGSVVVLPFARYPNVDSVRAPGVDMLRGQSAVTCATVGVTTTVPWLSDDAIGTRSCGMVHGVDATLTGHDLVGADIIARDSHYSFARRRIATYDAGTSTMTWTSGTLTGATPTIQNPTAYILEPNFGFYVAGKAWMIDSAGEWAVERTGGRTFTRTLSLRTSDDSAPGGSLRFTPVASGLGPFGINAEGQSFILIDGLQVVDATTGLELTGTDHVQVSGVRVSRSALMAVRADNSFSLSLVGNTFEQSGFQGVSGSGTVELKISDNQIQAIGTHLPPNGDTMWWGINYFGVYSYDSDLTTISGNRFLDSAYIGVFIGPDTVPGNVSPVKTPM